MNSGMKLKKNINIPKPIQKPYPQLVLGTSGKRMMDIACREADGINLIEVKPEDLPKYVNNVKDNLKKYDRDISEFEISHCCYIRLEDKQQGMDKLKIKHGTIGNQYIGTLEDVKEEIERLEELGINKMVIWSVSKSKQSEIKDPLETFARKVI